MSDLPKLLLVDDRPQNLLALEALLRRRDAEILTADSGNRALELLLEHDVALALIDVQMPELDGFELAELMRSLERTREIPIIFVTAGLHDQARVFRGYESGAVDFLVKPLEPRILASKVGVFLQLYEQKRQLSERVAQLETALADRRHAEAALRAANLQLAEADRRKTEFLATLSHELRNPLAPIRNSAYILTRAAPGSEAAGRAVAVIDRQAGQLVRLVDDLLDVTRITRNKIQLQRAPLELNELARQTVEDQRSLFAEAGVELELRPAARPVFVHADANRLAQVLGNLLGNAAKFTGRGGTTRVTIDPDATAQRAVIRVADSGVGMSQEMLARVFEPFSQADVTLDRSRGGLGLGLALVKGLVELHDGDVAAYSEGSGRGAEFVVRLPLIAGDPVAPPPDEPAASRPRRVLVIEDNVDAADTLRQVLELREHAVEVAHDGPEGLAKARQFRPDVVLCDIGLPGMDGYAVARAFRTDEALKRTSLVALSGYAQPEDLRRAREAGFDRHLAKPPSLERLEQVLASLTP